MTDLDDTTAIVTGASRGFGRAITAELIERGVRVVGVARDLASLEQVRAELGPKFIPVVADAADGGVASNLIDTYRPQMVVLNAGAVPPARPLHHHSWRSFSVNWEMDVRQAFHWTREALLRPLPKGAVVVAISSGAALGGSPLSGGYAGAKATIRFLTGYAAAESEREKLGVRFVSILPKLTPATRFGMTAMEAYAQRQGVGVDEFVQASGPALEPSEVASAVASVIFDPDYQGKAYAVTGGGLTSLD